MLIGATTCFEQTHNVGWRYFLQYFGIIGANCGGVFNSIAYLYNDRRFARSNASNQGTKNVTAATNSRDTSSRKGGKSSSALGSATSSQTGQAVPGTASAATTVMTTGPSARMGVTKASAPLDMPV
ncbi:hypothetical protein HKX48_003918 [Thoreauomyces humboldtii]|nr:hypothetical protein HKX48_003918 [Thoreauomyces humboldtii]